MKTSSPLRLGLITPCLALLLALLHLQSVDAGITVSVNLYHTQYGYYTYAFLSPNATPPDFPDGTYVVQTPNYPTTGSQIIYQASGGTSLNSTGGGGGYFANYVDLMNDITNGFWSIWVTNGGTTQYKFRVTVTGLTSAIFGAAPIITNPQQDAQNVPEDLTFTWTGPANWMGSLYVNDDFVDSNGDYNYVDSDSLPPSSTSWTPSTTLPIGTNSFNLGYDSNITAMVVASVPTNSSGTAISGWTSTANMNASAWVDFVVSGAGSEFNQFLVARYNFEDPGSPGIDTSGNGNNNNCSGSSGPNPVYDIASTDAAVGTFARQFYGDSWICLTEGGSAFPNLSNAIAGNFSVTAWVKTTSSVGSDDDDADWGMGILYADDFGDSHAIPLSLTGNKAAFTIYDSFGDPTTVHSTTDVNDGSYHFIAVTRDQNSGLMQMFVDGNLEDSTTATTDDLIAATYFDIASANNNYTGLLDDLRIYATNLTAGDVATLFGNPPTSPLSEAVDAPQFTWTTGGDANWFSQTSTTHDGMDAAQSGAIGDDEYSWIETTITGPGTLTFWWNVDSDDFISYDYLEFDVDGNYENEIAGSWGWDSYEIQLDAGQHTLRWTYYKDSNDAAGADAAWLDEISFTPAAVPIITFQPIDLTNYSGYPVTLIADATSTPEATWQWYKVGSGAISDATSRFYTPTNSGTAMVAGSYYALASNDAGSTSTRTALVSFVSAPLDPDWTKAFQTQLTGNFDNPRTNYGIAMLVDASGNVYSANSFTGTNDFATNTFVSGPGRFASGLFKHSAAGSGIWGRAITNNGNGNSYPQCVAKAPGDGVYMSGVFHGTNQIGTNLLQSPLDIPWLYLVRFDAAGNVLWVRTFGGTNSQFQSYHQLVSDAAGNVTISALGNNFVNFGSTNITLAGQKGILVQYDANGDLRWISQPSSWVQYMASDSTRIYAVFGAGETNYIGGITNTTDRRYALAALNATNGAALWLQGFGSAANAANPSSYSDVPAVSVSGADLFVTGLGLDSSATFGAVTATWPSFYSQYFARYNTNGTAQLATTFGGTNTWPWAAVADASGNVYVAGDFDGYAAFGNKVIGGPRLGGIGDPFRGQMFVAKFDRNGNSLWVRQGQAETASSFVNVRDLGLATDGVWTCGFVNYYANFGTNLANRVYGPITIFGFPFGYIYYWTGGYLAKVGETGATAPLAVTLLNPQSTGANFEFQFLSQAGFTHYVLYRTNLAAGLDWRTNSTIPGDGTTKTGTVPFSVFSPAQQGFIRVSTQ